MGQKRGQVTVYIILGIIALVSVSVFFYMRSEKVEAPLSYRPAIEQVPLEAQPIQQFVQACVEQVASDGLKKIGDYGGYISPEAMSASPNYFEPTMGNAVQFSPGSGLIVPYWWHMSSANDCEKTGSCRFSSQRPNLYKNQGEPSIEAQLDTYVNENLKGCLKGFVDLADFGFEISETGEVDAKTVVTQESVAFHVRYPLLAQKAGVSYNINEYFVDVPLNLREMYEIATEVAEFQANASFLEQFMKNTIAIFSDIDAEKLPPTSDMGLDPNGGVSWMKSQVKQKLSELMMSYVPMLQVPGTRSYNPVIFPEDSKYVDGKFTLLNYQLAVPMKQAHPNLEVKFSYLDWWKPYFNMNCQGELCKPEEASGIGTITFFMQRYHFNYDFSMPVLVSIVNPYAFLGKGYTFNMFIEGNLRDNEKISSSGVLPEPALNIGTGTMLCDENKRLSPEITIETIDGRTGLGFPNAIINFKCGAEQCYMGRADEFGFFTAKFPLCAGGIAQISKDGYIGKSEQIATYADAPYRISSTLYPYVDREIEVKKYKLAKNCVAAGIPGSNATPASSGYSSSGLDFTEYSGVKGLWSCNWKLQESSEPLNAYESASVILTRVSEDGSEPFVAAAEYLGDRTADPESRIIRIAPGKYDITIYTTTAKEFTVPQEERCGGGFMGIGEACSTFEAESFGPERLFASGGAALKSLTISHDVYTNDKIVFYAISAAIEEVQEMMMQHEDLQIPTSASQSAESYKKLLAPIYENIPESEGGRSSQTSII